MRISVAQFATSLNVQENLATCIRMINQMAVCKPSLMILPEFCNTQSWYVDHNQAWNNALDINGYFLQSIAEQAKNHDCYIVINVTLRRDHLRAHQNSSSKSNISVTSCIFSPLGELVYQMDKLRLTGHENEFFSCGSRTAKIMDTPYGKFGLLSGNDSLSFEKPHELASQGSHLLCNSINTFAIDQSQLHDPARACENNVFLATANKIGLLVPKEQSAILSEQYFTPQESFFGAGQSQIVSPEGKVLAKIANNEEGFIFADINLDTAEAGFNNKLRPDGTQIARQLRPELYQKLTTSIKQLQLENKTHRNQNPLGINNVPTTANVAIFATYRSNEQAIEDVCHYIENNLSDIIQLPELFFVEDKAITNDTEQLIQIESLSKKIIKQVSSVLRPFQYLCTSLIIDGTHQAVLINEHGLLETQKQLHFCQRYKWSKLGDELNIIELPLEQGNINLAMLTADDANIAEIVNIAALSGIHTLLVPFDIQEPCEVEYNLLSRAAENRICIVAASREKSFDYDIPIDNSNVFNKNKTKLKKSTGLIVNLTTNFALLPQWKPHKFNGYLNQPLVKYQYGKITKAVIHPIAACDKGIRG